MLATILGAWDATSASTKTSPKTPDPKEFIFS